jgi:Trypsin-like peptidase domain
MKISGTYLTGASGVRGGFFDGLDRDRNPWEAIFPIVQMLSEVKWRPVGTGFFISTNGLFATARHVVIDSTGSPLPDLFGLQLPADLSRGTLREIKKLELHSRADVAIGFLFDKPYAESGSQTTNPLFTLTAATPSPGDRILSFAYPNSSSEDVDDGTKLLLTGNAMDGAFEEAHPDGRDSVLLPGPCFRTSMHLAPGSSGGPVAFGDGGVFGVNSTGFDGSDVSYISPTSSLLDLTVRNIRLLDGTIRDRISVAELADLGLVRFAPHRPIPAS